VVYADVFFSLQGLKNKIQVTFDVIGKDEIKAEHQLNVFF
jgi:hypothetical protein